MKSLWLQRFTANLLRYRWYAVSLAFFSTLVGVCVGQVISGMPVLVKLFALSACIFLTLFAILLATLVTLVNGVIEGALVTLAATAPYLLTIYMPMHNGADLSAASLWFWIALGVAIGSNVLTWVFAIMLRRKTSASLLVQIAALSGVLVVSVLHLAYPGVADWWGSQLTALLQTYHTQAANAAGTGLSLPEVPAEMQAEAVNVIKQLMNGMIVMLVLVNAMFQLVLARWWQAAVYSPGSLKYELRGIRLSPIAGVLFLLGLALSYQGNGVVLDVMPIVYVLFGAAGLSLVHYIVNWGDSSYAWFWLMVLYLVLFTVPFSIVIVTMLALFDIWLNVRGRMIK